MINKCTTTRKRAFHVFFVLLIIQIILFNFIGYIYKDSISNNEALATTKTLHDTVLISDTIRSQQRNTLQGIRQSWVQYLQTHPSTLVIKNGEKVVYFNNETTIYYNEKTMYRKQNSNKLFDIYLKEGDKQIAADTRPQWNDEEVAKILNIIAAPVKSFGNNSSILIFDSYTGKVIMDTSFVNRTAIPGYSIFTDYKNPNNKNPEETKIVTDQDLRMRKDTDRFSSIVYMFNESTRMGNNANNFEKYPLGEYNRLFVEKIILPYETIGVDGQPMQLTMSILTDEKDVISPYEKVSKDYNLYAITNKNIFGKTTLIIVCSTLISMMSILVSIYVLKTLNSKCAINKIEGESEVPINK